MVNLRSLSLGAILLHTAICIADFVFHLKLVFPRPSSKQSMPTPTLMRHTILVQKQSELRCMVREFGMPTLFLTFSCAEYDSHDIADYLKTVNNVPEGYDVRKH